MKITNLDKGKAYQLGEGAKLEVERTNPFFNDYGETTSPLDIPASDYNRMILNYPDTFGTRDKMVATNVSIEDGEYFYFVHSYAMPVNAYTIAQCNYGEPFTAAVQKDNFYGVQFHPERSGAAGAQLLKNFLEM